MINHLKIRGITVTSHDAEPIIEMIRDGMPKKLRSSPIQISLSKLHADFGESSRVIAEDAIDKMMSC